MCFFFFKQKTAYEMRISDWSSDVCSSDLSVGNQNMRVLDGLADQRTRSAPRKRLLHEQMAVGGLSLQRDKQMPGLDLPGIKRNATRNKPRARNPPGCGRDLFRCPKRPHAAHSRATVTDRKSTRLNSSH